MCDQNIAVSIRELNQKSSVIPNRMEKLKLASLSAGIVAGFTTDCTYSTDMSIAKGYDTMVSGRVSELSNVLRSYIVLNQSWYETGAKTISNIRNVFVTGRKHPLNTLENVFALITRTEANQNANENSNNIAEARAILRKYDLPLDVPFYRIMEDACERGLLTALTTFREATIRKAKRITSEGKRLDILDENQLSVVNSVITGLVVGYIEPLPSTVVDFNDYYATTAYPAALGLINSLVEKLHINTDLLFSAYRSTLETRYEMAFEPVATVRGLLAVAISNDVLAKDMGEAITNSNKEELLDYIVGMVKGVYDVRKDALERTVMHELDYLPIEPNPIGAMLNRPESHDEIQKRMEEMLVSNESAMQEIEKILTSKQLDRLRTISTEAMTGSQKFGALLLVLGGALMAYAVYLEFFKKEKEVAARTAEFKAEIKRATETTNNMLAQHAKNDLAFSEYMKDVSKEIDRVIADTFGSDWMKSCGVTNANEGKKAVESVTNGLQAKQTNVVNIKLSVLKYELKGDLGNEIGDLSVTTIKENLDRFVKYKQALANNELESKILPERFSNIKSKDEFDKLTFKIEDEISIIAKTYRPMPWRNKTDKIVTDEQVLGYMKHNFNNPELIKGLEECVKFSEANVNRVSSIDYEGRVKEYETILKKNMPDLDEKHLRSRLNEIGDLNKKIQEVYRMMGQSFIRFNKLVMAWDDVVRRRNRFIANSVNLVTKVKPPSKLKV